MAKTMTRREARGVVQSYDDALKYLDGQPRRKLCRNTYVYMIELGCTWVEIVLYDTTIVWFWKDGRIGLTDGGWPTPTTRDRMSLVLPDGLSVSLRDKRLWLVHDCEMLHRSNRPWASIIPASENNPLIVGRIR